MNQEYEQPMRDPHRTAGARAAFAGLLCLVLLAVAPVQGQVVREERTPDGIPINQDYFAADDRYPETKELLALVEAYHMGDIVMDNFAPGRYPYALNDLRYTLHKFPNHPKALMFVTTIASVTDQPSMPIPYFEQAIRIYPQYAITHYQYGRYLVDIERFEEGIAELKKAIELDESLALAHAGLAGAYARIGDPERARSCAERARELGYEGDPLAPAL